MIRRPWQVLYILTDGSQHLMTVADLATAKKWHARLTRSRAVTECWLRSPRGCRAEAAGCR